MGYKVSIKMSGTQMRKKRAQKNVLRHKLSVILISAVLVILIGMLSIGSIHLYKKMDTQDTLIAELKKQKQSEEKRAEELKEKEEYYNSDKYIEDVARDKGLAYENETLFKPTP